MREFPQTEKTTLTPFLTYPIFIVPRPRTLARAKLEIAATYIHKTSDIAMELLDFFMSAIFVRISKIMGSQSAQSGKH